MLYLFDVDGTIAERGGSYLYPKVRRWFEQNKPKDVALVSNQGGVGLRYYLESIDKDIDPKYPTIEQVEVRLNKLSHKIENITKEKVLWYVSYGYVSKAGNFLPTPSKYNKWSEDWRKPNTGMVLEALRDFGKITGNTIMIGDYKTDMQCAYNAKIKFEWASDFFN